MQNSARSVPVGKTTIWIDLDNTPHVPFFDPIIQELGARGFDTVVTARDAFQVCEMADQKGLKYTKVGRHHGKNAILKLVGLYWRAAQLLPLIRAVRPDIAVSHGSRAQSIVAKLLGIPNVIIADYEHAKFLPLTGPDWEIVPDVIPEKGLYCRADRILKYPGIKEDVYVPRFKADGSIREALGLKSEEIVVTARPPASEAHYRNPESDVLFNAFLKKAMDTPDVKVVLLPRNGKQESELRREWPDGFGNGRIVVPKRAVDGLNLLWHSDLAVSGGGTMNREAAALGVPVYSVFRGAIGAVDRDLAEKGRLMLLESVNDLQDRLKLERRAKEQTVNVRDSAGTLEGILGHIEVILDYERKKRGKVSSETVLTAPH